MTPDEFRKLALAMPETVEREHMGHPDFRVRNKIFATLSEDETSGVLNLDLDQQEEVVGDEGGAFEALPGTWGMRGWTRVRLAKARKGPVRRALRMAWEHTAPKEMRGKPETRRGGQAPRPATAGRLRDNETKSRTADDARSAGKAAGMDVGIALIRGINVTGRNTLPMESLRAMCGKIGLCDARTYIASGNVVFRCDATGMAEYSEKLEAAIEKRRGFRPRVIVRMLAELRRVVSSCGFADVESLEPNRVLVMFLEGAPSAAARKAATTVMTAPERLAVRGRDAFLYYPSGVGTAETPMSAVEKALGVAGTCRNWNTVKKLVEMGEELQKSGAAKQRDSETGKKR